MSKVIRLTEADLTRIVKRVIKEQSNKSNAELIATFIDTIKDIYGWSYNPSNSSVSEFALVPTDIGYDGTKHDSFRKYIGKPLVFEGKDDTTMCYIDKRNNIVLKHLGKKTTYPLQTNIKQILSSL